MPERKTDYRSLIHKISDNWCDVYTSLRTFHLLKFLSVGGWRACFLYYVLMCRLWTFAIHRSPLFKYVCTTRRNWGRYRNTSIAMLFSNWNSRTCSMQTVYKHPCCPHHNWIVEFYYYWCCNLNLLTLQLSNNIMIVHCQ